MATFGKRVFLLLILNIHENDKILKAFIDPFQANFPFYNPRKHQKTTEFLIFLGGIER